MPQTTHGIAFEIAGPEAGGAPITLVHAGIADRRMWDDVWPALTTAHRCVRLDLRGFGESTSRPDGLLDHAADVLEVLAEAGIAGTHLVGSSLGSGTVVDAALRQPDVAASLALVAPGGALIAAPTEELRTFWRAEREALDRGDLDAAVEANLRTWVDGRGRAPGDVDPTVRRLVGEMQRRAFEITADWDDVEEAEPDPPILDRLAEIRVPTLVLLGDRDVDAVGIAANTVVERVPGARLVQWRGVAHVPSLERPAEFIALLEEWLRDAGRS
ncbi:MAG: alpha/beta fold hydrolase [Chloroflexota bacterium]